MDREFAVHYFSKESIKKEEFLKKFDNKGNMLVDQAEVEFSPPDYLYDIHVVFSMNEMLNYIVFREYLHNFQQKEDKN
jgi:hypothetical protein